MTTALATKPENNGKLSTWIANPEAKSRIEAALGDIMPADTFCSHMLVAMQAETVRKCSPQSQYTALMECAAMGLLPTLNQVRLIPYKDEIKAMPQWQGYKSLMERHPVVLEVTAYLVHVSDTFAFRNGEVLHEYDPFSDSRKIAESKDIRGGYLKVTYRDGRPPKYHVVTVAQITKCQRCAQTQNVWKNWYEQMALKTVYRDAFARRVVPLDPFVSQRLQAVLAVDDLNLGNEPTPELREAATKTERLVAEPVTQPQVVEEVMQDAEPMNQEVRDEVDNLSQWLMDLEAAASKEEAYEALKDAKKINSGWTKAQLSQMAAAVVDRFGEQ